MLILDVTNHNLLCKPQRASWLVLVRESFMEEVGPYLNLTGGTDMDVQGMGGAVFQTGLFLCPMRPCLVLPEIIIQLWLLKKFSA